LFEYVVGLHVINEDLYAKYRENMTPLLESFGGGFHYDFCVSDVLKTQTQNKINRVFTIYFPTKQASEKFFSHEEYLLIKEKYFEKAVESTTIISEYEK